MGVVEPQRDAQRFATTQWSVVAAASRGGSPDSRQALAALCEAYWYPLYAYVRRRGHDEHQAQDLTQEFFATLLEKDSLRVADRERGKFRSFMLAALKHFLAKARRRAGAQKRGGGQLALSLDFESGERRYHSERSHELAADRIFERRWAMTLLEQTLTKLQAEYAEGGKLPLFERLKAYLGRDQGAAPYRDIAADLGMTEGAVKVAVHRLRRHCRELLRNEIAQTVAGPAEVEEELRDLFDAVAG